MRPVADLQSREWWVREGGGFLILFLVILVGCASARAAAAAVDVFTVFVNVDENPDTGCAVATSKGVFNGADLALVTTVTTSATDSQVTRVVSRACAGVGMFGPPVVVDEGDWPVGLGVGSAGTALIETYLPLALLGGTDAIQVAIVGEAGAGGADAMLVAPGGGPIRIVLRASATPVTALQATGTAQF